MAFLQSSLDFLSEFVPISTEIISCKYHRLLILPNEFDRFNSVWFCSCWLSLYESVVWSLVGPVCVLVICNLIVLLLSLRAAFTLKDHVAGYGNLRYCICFSVSIYVSFGKCSHTFENDCLQNTFVAVCRLATFTGVSLDDRITSSHGT